MVPPPVALFDLLKRDRDVVTRAVFGPVAGGGRSAAAAVEVGMLHAGGRFGFSP